MAVDLKFWTSLDALRADADRRAAAERDCFAGQRARTGPPPEPSRRDFLTLAGFGIAAAAASACSRGAVQKAIPMLSQPEELTPGVPNWYATTCGGCSAACTLLAKTRDGRPIKIEGNADSVVFGSGTCATGQATVLSLYDDARLKGPLWRGQPAAWADIDAHIAERLAAAAVAHQRVALVSKTIAGPATRRLIAEWSRRPGFEHIVYDAVSVAALREATRAAFGVDALPHYRFDAARVIVGIESDFLGTWLSPVEFTREYAMRRRPESASAMSRHVQFESGVSLTGSNADRRVVIRPSQSASVALGLLRRIASRRGEVAVPDVDESALDRQTLDAAADDLWRARGESLVVCGANDVDTQMLVHAANALLGNIGTTVDLDNVSLQKRGDDVALARLVDAMAAGRVGGLILYGVNPVYDAPAGDQFAAAMRRVPLTVSFADRLDETASHAEFVCPDHHFLEAWGDAEPVASCYSLAQPTISPLFDTRAAQDSLLLWLGRSPDFYAYLRSVWRDTLFHTQTRYTTFDEFWDHSLHDGIYAIPPRTISEKPLVADWRASAASVARSQSDAAASRDHDTYELHLYEPVAVRDGAHANNPWLQELPDPVSKVTWGNYAAIAPVDASRLGLEPGDIVALDGVGGRRIELPVHVQPGQAPKTISIALGYGRTRSGRVGDGVGVNVFALAQVAAGARRYARTGITMTRTGRRDALATTQSHHSMEGRAIVKETTLAALAEPADHRETDLPTLWAARPRGEHNWGMAIDLSACTGCSACVTACQAENNVAVVGRDEVRRGREMHWIRIDRYYSGSEDGPATLVQPMMCQHCGDAPCEPVCPVLATVHSSDGLNQQVYNRCVGTRYCENNCPYKVRRFNWFEYARNDRFDFNLNNPLGLMVLNPDVTVRSRGVMEKCSLCVQRIQAGKLEARRSGRAVDDGEIQTACQQACPADAIVFGDLADPGSRVSQLNRGRRSYHVLDELGTRPNVTYLTKVRNA
ncbi:MAG TPA: 4Fe-4S dicluster domain-containing protein [Vicinamibacterales bacterium]|nr:4Fe-4S dicluster domain-containing protein [Vicinamibacterales bacterium]